MQVFIVGSPLETAMALDKRRLNRQIQETKVILDALNGAKAWSNHPCVLQYRGHEDWLLHYQWCLESYYRGVTNGTLDLEYYDARDESRVCEAYKPTFHTQEYFKQMKRRLYTKDPVYYEEWAYLGESEDNWYWSPSEGKFIKYRNGKRI